MKRFGKSLIVLLLIASVLMGCGPSTPKVEVPTDEGSGTLKLTASRVLETLNHHQHAASDTSAFLGLVVGLLYRFVPGETGSGYQVVPEMAAAEPVKVDEEGKVWRITVSKNAKWANGEPITAEDFVYSWQMLLDPKLANHRAAEFQSVGLDVMNSAAYFKGEATWEEVGIKLVGDDIIELTVSVPVTSFVVKNALAQESFGPVYKSLYEGGMNADRTETDYGIGIAKMMSSGPFKAATWVGDAEYSAVKNPHYILKNKVWLAGVNYRVISESGTVMQMFETKQIDYVSLSEANYERYREDPRLISVPGTSVLRMAVNLGSTAKPILGNLKFRQALYYALDRAQCAEITQSVPGDYIITERYISDVESGTIYRDTSEAKAILDGKYGYDPVRAKQLFDEALAEEGLTSVTLQLDYHDGNESRKKVSEYVQKAYEDLFEGRLTIKLQAVPSTPLAAKIRSYVDNVNAFELAWTASSFNVFDPASILCEFYSETPRRKGPYFSEEFDSLYEQIVATPLSAVQQRTKLIADAEEVLLRDASFIPAVPGYTHAIVADRVQLAVDGYTEGLGLGWAWAKIAK